MFYKSIFKEKITRDRVVRKGKKILKFSTDKEGYKIHTDDGRSPKEVKMSPIELRKRSKGAKKGAKKARSKSKQAQIKRAKSIKRR